MKKALGLRIKHYRESKNLSQAQLASAMDAHKQTISGWENGRSWPEFPQILALAKVLDVKPERFFEGITGPPPSQILPRTRLIDLVVRMDEHRAENFLRELEVPPSEKRERLLAFIRQAKDSELGPFLSVLKGKLADGESGEHGSGEDQSS